jgi:A/G-specific adenine glycosylase
VACATQHEGQVPTTIEQLRALPGVGEYTAAAVASFAFQQRHAVLDTNVRRVQARLLDGRQFEESGSATVAERRRALALLPQDPAQAARASIAVMELGALICKAQAPNCDSCPAVGCCTWNLVGQPAWDGPMRRGQTYAGTDRQCRGHLLAIVRDASDAVATANLIESWSDQQQSKRALASLIADGLLEASASTTDGPPAVTLPGN